MEEKAQTGLLILADCQSGGGGQPRAGLDRGVLRMHRPLPTITPPLPTETMQNRGFYPITPIIHPPMPWPQELLEVHLELEQSQPAGEGLGGLPAIIPPLPTELLKNRGFYPITPITPEIRP